MGHISFVGKLDGVTLSAGAPAIAPGWTLELMGKHSLDFWLTSEDLPDPDNRVTLDRDGRIVLAYTPNNGEGHARLIKKLEHLMQQQTRCEVHGDECHQGLFTRNLFVGQRIPLAGVAHQNGTIRFGHDPKTSALDPNCRAHEVDNLYVVDGSFFPSSGAVNPALTIMANALARRGPHPRAAGRERRGSRAEVTGGGWTSVASMNYGGRSAEPGQARTVRRRWASQRFCGRSSWPSWPPRCGPVAAALGRQRRQPPQCAVVRATRPAAAQAVAMVGLTVSDMDSSVAFYTRILDFTKASATTRWPERRMRR